MFWQESGLGLLETAGVIKDSTYFSATSITVGISALLACFEMVLFGESQHQRSGTRLTLHSHRLPPHQGLFLPPVPRSRLSRPSSP